MAWATSLGAGQFSVLPVLFVVGVSVGAAVGGCEVLVVGVIPLLPEGVLAFGGFWLASPGWKAWVANNTASTMVTVSVTEIVMVYVILQVGLPGVGVIADVWGESCQVVADGSEYNDAPQPLQKASFGLHS